MGPIKIKFVPPNDFGILDHEVMLESGRKFYNPMRVITNGNGSEVVFTLIRQPDMTVDQYNQDAAWVEKDLGILKDLLEKEFI